jgi:hypothetical protein
MAIPLVKGIPMASENKGKPGDYVSADKGWYCRRSISRIYGILTNVSAVGAGYVYDTARCAVVTCNAWIPDPDRLPGDGKQMLRDLGFEESCGNFDEPNTEDMDLAL